MVANSRAVHTVARIFAVAQPVFKRAVSKRLAPIQYMPLVQLVRDFLFRRSLRIFRENVADYCGLLIVNGYAVYNALIAVFVGVNEFIPVNESTAAISAVLNACVKSVVYALGKALRILFVVPLQKHFVELAALVVAHGFGCRNNPYAVPLF